MVKINIGTRVGQWEVISPTEERKNGYMVWRCRCTCGSERNLDTRCLQRGTILDCGCHTRVPPGIKDLIGHRFGKLVVKELTDQRASNGGVIWHCQCDCGKEAEVSARQLLNGDTKSCGCLSRPPLKDYVGKQFGQLTVLGYAGKRAGMHRWACLCSCGNHSEVGQTLLQSGKTKSCGCLQATVYQENLKLIDGTSVTVLESLRQKRSHQDPARYPGVYQDRRTGKWIASITFKGRKHYLGSYELWQDAIRARKKGESLHDEFLAWYESEQLGNIVSVKQDDGWTAMRKR